MINLIQIADVILGFHLNEKRSSAVSLAGVPAPVGEPRAQHVLRYRVGTVTLPAKFKEYQVSLSTFHSLQTSSNRHSTVAYSTDILYYRVVLTRTVCWT